MVYCIAIGKRLAKEEFEKYKDIFIKAKEEHVAERKIELVKDILPSNLRPDGINPLGRLHQRLSEGLHSKSEDECLEIAKDIRIALVFLLEKLDKKADLDYTEAIKRLDKEKAKKHP